MADILTFLRLIAEDPGDRDTRLVFADWLEERGDWRAEFLRLDCLLAGMAKHNKDYPGTKARWEELWARLTPSWRAVLGRSEIENCVQVHFRFQCPKKWEKLRPTGLAAVRFCDACRESVFYCGSIEEARDHATQGHCVAVDAGLARSLHDLDLQEKREVFLGILDTDGVDEE
jgi:uncharacterized protein (TIGR02996 family)